MHEYMCQLSAKQHNHSKQIRGFAIITIFPEHGINSQRTTGSPGVLGSEVTFVRFVSNMKPRYLGTSNHIIKVGIEAFSYGKWGSKWGVEQKNRQNFHFGSNFSLKSKMIFRIRNMRQETLCYTKIVQGIQIWGPIITSAIYNSVKLWKSHQDLAFFQ